MSLRALIEDVTGGERTLTLLDPTLEPGKLQTIGEYFEPQGVTLRTVRTDESRPQNVAILHDGPAFVAASDLETVYERVDPATGLASADDIADVSVPAVLEHVDDTTFTEFGKRRMIVASREIEKRAWLTGDGTVYAGFQSLSLLAAQASVYGTLVDSGVETHVFGLPDWSPPASLGVVPHGLDDEEIAESWFVVFDGAGDPDRKCALLAREVRDNRYAGFWTYRADVVNRIGAHVYETHIV
jgi:DICT domain-containing protein